MIFLNNLVNVGFGECCHFGILFVRSRGYLDKFIFKLLFAKKKKKVALVLHSCRTVMWPDHLAFGGTSYQSSEVGVGQRQLLDPVSVLFLLGECPSSLLRLGGHSSSLREIQFLF